MRKRLRYSTTFFASVSNIGLSSHTSRAGGQQDRVWGSRVLAREDQVYDRLKNLNTHKSMGPEEMHLRDL